MRNKKEHYGMMLSLLHMYDFARYQTYIDSIQDKVLELPMQINTMYGKKIILNNIRKNVKGEYEIVDPYGQYINIGSIS